MLGHMVNLTSLRREDAREKFEPRAEQNLDLNMLLHCIEMPQVRKLELVGGAVTQEVMTEKLVWAFPELKFLELELLDMGSNDDNCWVEVLGGIKAHHEDIGFGPLVGLRQRRLDGKDYTYVKRRVKKQKATEEQVDGLWNKVAKAEEDE